MQHSAVKIPGFTCLSHLALASSIVLFEPIVRFGNKLYLTSAGVSSLEIKTRLLFLPANHFVLYGKHDFLYPLPAVARFLNTGVFRFINRRIVLKLETLVKMWSAQVSVLVDFTKKSACGSPSRRQRISK